MNNAPNGHTEPGFPPLTGAGLDRPSCPPFRQYVWLTHQASPRLFAEVGDYTPGLEYPSADFMEAFLRDPFQPHAYHPDDNLGGNRIPQYFTINGQSGFFSHFSPTITMMGRAGEPCVVHIMNAGLWAHSMHLHANHMWITSVDGVPNTNPIWVDVYRVDPLQRIDYTVPYMRPPSVGWERGIGPAGDPEDVCKKSSLGTTAWPPVEEMNMHIPDIGELKAFRLGGFDDQGRPIRGAEIDLQQRLSPLCYPMHDHSEPTQTSQGGNYNMGMIAGMNFTGDRNTAGGVTNFPNQPIVGPPACTPAGVTKGAFTPAVNPPWFQR